MWTSMCQCYKMYWRLLSCWYTWWFTDPINPGRSNRSSLSTKIKILSFLKIRLDDMKNANFDKNWFFRRKSWINKLPLMLCQHELFPHGSSQLRKLVVPFNCDWFTKSPHWSCDIWHQTQFPERKSFQFIVTKQVKELQERNKEVGAQTLQYRVTVN